MSHELDITSDGTVRFAYNLQDGRPWHVLGQPIDDAEATAAQMLRAARCDFEVRTYPVIAVEEVIQPDGTRVLVPIQNLDGSYVEIEDSRATVRIDSDLRMDGLSTVGTRYIPEQNEVVLNKALSIVEASDHDAVVSTVGATHGGKRFFAAIDLGKLVIDPLGINDTIERWLLVYNSHDGKVPTTYANTPIRAVCNNTVRAGLSRAKATFKARHTRNALEFDMEEARKALNLSVQWAEEFKILAEQMLAIPVAAPQIDKVLKDVFPLDSSATDRVKRNHDEKMVKIRGIYQSEKNAAGFGNNGWSLYNAIGEYLDHHREGTAQERALTSMDETSWVTKAKVKAQEAVLALA